MKTQKEASPCIAVRLCVSCVPTTIPPTGEHAIVNADDSIAPDIGEVGDEPDLPSGDDHLDWGGDGDWI